VTGKKKQSHRAGQNAVSSSAYTSDLGILRSSLGRPKDSDPHVCFFEHKPTQCGKIRIPAYPKIRYICTTDE